MSQILVNAPATLTFYVYAGNPLTLTDFDATPTASAVDANGATVTVGTPSRSSLGTYTVSLAGQTALKVVDVTLSGNIGGSAVSLVQRHEIVGNLLFATSDLRTETIVGAQTPVSNTTTYTDAAVNLVREVIGDRFEAETGRSFIRRYCREKTKGSGGYRLEVGFGEAVDSNGRKMLRPGRTRDVASVISAVINTTSATAANIVIDGEDLIRTDGVWLPPTLSYPVNVTLEYTYGLDPTPPEAARMARKVALQWLPPSALSAWAQTISTPVGSEQLRTAAYSWAWPPDVYAWLKKADMNLMIA